MAGYRSVFRDEVPEEDPRPIHTTVIGSRLSLSYGIVHNMTDITQPCIMLLDVETNLKNTMTCTYSISEIQKSVKCRFEREIFAYEPRFRMQPAIYSGSQTSMTAASMLGHAANTCSLSECIHISRSPFSISLNPHMDLFCS